MLILDNMEFNIKKKGMRDKEKHYKMRKTSIYQEDRIIIEFMHQTLVLPNIRRKIWQT